MAGLVGLGLMIWGAVFGIRRRGRWDGEVARGFWLRFAPGWVVLLIAFAATPDESSGNAVAGLVVLTGLGLMVWGAVFGLRRRGWNRQVAGGFAARFGVGLLLFLVAGAFTAPTEPTSVVADPPVTTTPPPSPAAPPPPSAPAAPPRHVPAGVPQDAQQAVVLQVRSGDSVQLAATEPGTSLAVSAPVEGHLLHLRVPECFAAESADHLRQLAPVGSTVWVQHDQQPQDPQGHHLLYAWNGSGVFTNADMVAGGFAEPAYAAPNSLHWEEIAGAGDQARAVRAGSWSRCAPPPPPTSTRPSPSPQPNPEPNPEPRPQPQPQPVYPPPDDGGGSVSFKNCTEARAAGVTPLHRGEPGYSSKLDRDGDGTACE